MAFCNEFNASIYILTRRPLRSTLFPYTTLFRSLLDDRRPARVIAPHQGVQLLGGGRRRVHSLRSRSEEHTSELQSRSDLVCRLLLEKKKKKTSLTHKITTRYY